MEYNNRATSKYSQLVEAQSPEPQQIDSCNLGEFMLEGSRNNDDSKSNKSRISVKSATEMTELTDRRVGLNNQPEGHMPTESPRNTSSEDSSPLMSCNSPTSSSCQKQKSMNKRGQSSSFEPGSMDELRIRDKSIQKKDGKLNISSSNSCLTSYLAYNLTRTITQSMQDLDKGASSSSKFEVRWTDLSYGYATPGINIFRGKSASPQKRVLHNISGRFKSNQLIAMIGPSGCGKTTLLQFLSGNEDAACSSAGSGSVKIIGLDEPKVAYIGQHDCLLPGLTVHETLLYASKLQNNKPNFNHEHHINIIINQLGLYECKDRYVTEISGGQIKRVTIAQELLYPTNILILDEVTSGLDAATSYSIVKLLKQLVSNHDYPMSIIMSIHQPSARLFSVFDQVFVISEGQILYDGDCGTDMIIDHLKQFNLECPRFHNIADFLIEIASDESQAMKEIKSKMIEHQNRQARRIQDEETVTSNGNYQDSYFNNSNIDENVNEKSHLKISMAKSQNLFDSVERARSRRSRPFWGHLYLHFSRSILRIRRSYILTYLQVITYLILSVQLATFFGNDIGSKSGCPSLPASFLSYMLIAGGSSDAEAEEAVVRNIGDMRRVQENGNMLLIVVLGISFAALEIVVITFPMEAKTVKREWRNGWYKVASYFIGRTLADLPFQVVFVIIFTLIIYIGTGQIGLSTWRFTSFTMITISMALFAQSIGLIFGALFMNNLPAAVFLAPLCMFPSLLFSGFFMRLSQMPYYYIPFTRVSHFSYGFEALIVTIYGHNRCECDQDTLTNYHSSLKHQNRGLRDVLSGLFGSSDCESSNHDVALASTLNPNENSIEDITTKTSMISAASGLSANPYSPASSTSFKVVEDQLVDSAFAQMQNQSIADNQTLPTHTMDRMLDRLASRITTLTNANANFGYPVPTECYDFRSYLMTEFELHDQDLLIGLGMLILFVLVSRLLCYMILNLTIATRAK